MRLIYRITLFSLTITAGISGCATTDHDRHGNAPTEAGQSAFAAIAEIADIVNRDKTTDWSKIDISALREHLIDMNELTLNTKVVTQLRDASISFQVSGSGRTLRAIQTMVPAHARQLKQSLGWVTEVENSVSGTTLTLRTNSPQQLERFSALGFFGVMATGAHHQKHHLQMATGQGHSHAH